MAVRKSVLCALFAALTVLSSWLSIPFGPVRFTLQTLTLSLALGLLGGKWGSICTGVYLALGLAGLPVFSGFQAGIGVLLGPTGGFLIGFALLALVYWLITALAGNRPWVRLAALITGHGLMYLCGCLWYSVVYAPGTGLWAAALQCVVPYLLPDGIKLAAAFALTGRLRRFTQ